MISRRQVLELVTLVTIGAALELQPAGQSCTEPDDTEPEPEPP